MELREAKKLVTKKACQYILCRAKYNLRIIIASAPAAALFGVTAGGITRLITQDDERAIRVGAVTAVAAEAIFASHQCFTGDTSEEAFKTDELIKMAFDTYKGENPLEHTTREEFHKQYPSKQKTRGRLLSKQKDA